MVKRPSCVCEIENPSKVDRIADESVEKTILKNKRSGLAKLVLQIHFGECFLDLKNLKLRFYDFMKYPVSQKGYQTGLQILQKYIYERTSSKIQRIF